MSLLQDYYPAIRDGKEVYGRIDFLTKDEVFANCCKMLADAGKFNERARFDAAEHLMKHAEELRDYFDNKPDERIESESL